MAQILPHDLLALKDRVMDAAHRVHRKLGAGFKESIYRECLAHAMTRDGIEFQREVWLDVEFEGLILTQAGRPDFIVEERMVVEVKATLGNHPTHGFQVINYLKASELEMGILLNFNVPYLKQGYNEYVHPSLLRRSM